MTVNEMGFDTVDLNNRVESLKEQLNTLRASRDTMVDEINALNGMWKGKANDSFKVEFSKDCQEIDAMFETIDGIINAFNESRVEYEKCENEVDGLVSEIRV